MDIKPILLVLLVQGADRPAEAAFHLLWLTTGFPTAGKSARSTGRDVIICRAGGVDPVDAPVGAELAIRTGVESACRP